MKLKRFTNPKTLRGLGRPLLGKFLDKFKNGLKGKGVVLPPDSAEDDDYFAALAKVFLSPNELPDDIRDLRPPTSDLRPRFQAYPSLVKANQARHPLPRITAVSPFLRFRA